MRRLIILLALACSVAGAAIPPLNLALAFSGVQSNSPLNLPRASAPSVTFLGSFEAPSTMAYGGAAMSVSGTTMCMTGGSGNYNSTVGCFTVPTLSGPAAYDGSNGTAGTPTVTPTNITANFGQSGCSTPLYITGTLISGSTLLMTGGPDYDTAGCATGFIVGASTDLTSVGAVNSSSTTNGTYQRFFAGSLGTVPSEWQPYFGGTCYVANGGSAGGGRGAPSVDTSSPAGLMLSTFNCSAYNSGATSAIPVKEDLDYYWTTYKASGGNSETLWNRSVTSPFPLAGGGGVSVTVADCNGSACATIPNVTTQLTLSAAFPGVDGETAGAFEIKFSDGETRLVEIGNGASNTAIPDGSSTCSDSVVSCTSFAALTGCGSGCSTTITVYPVGDNYFSLPGGYEGSFVTGYWVPGTRTFRFINVHSYGLDGGSQGNYNSCSTSSSGSNDTPISPDSAHYVQLQYEDYDLLDLYAQEQGTNPVYTASPYEIGAFPDQSKFPAYTGTQAISSMSYASGTVTVTASSNIPGNLIPTGPVTTWSVTIAGVTPSAIDGTYTATITGSTTFTFPLASWPGNPTVEGTYTPPNYGCIQMPEGSAFYDQSNSILYMYIGDSDANGHSIIGEFQVN